MSLFNCTQKANSGWGYLWGTRGSACRWCCWPCAPVTSAAVRGPRVSAAVARVRGPSFSSLFGVDVMHAGTSWPRWGRGRGAPASQARDLGCFDPNSPHRGPLPSCGRSLTRPRQPLTVSSGGPEAPVDALGMFCVACKAETRLKTNHHQPSGERDTIARPGLFCQRHPRFSMTVLPA